MATVKHLPDDFNSLPREARQAIGAELCAACYDRHNCPNPPCGLVCDPESGVMFDSSAKNRLSNGAEMNATDFWREHRAFQETHQ